MFPIVPYAETRFTKNWKLANGQKLNPINKERYLRHAHSQKLTYHEQDENSKTKGMVHRVICKPAPYNICYCTEELGKLNHLRNKRFMRVVRIYK